MIMTSASN